MKVYFHKFWPGFLEGTNPNTVHFFLELFRRVFNTDIFVERNYNNATILCENVWSASESLINAKHWKYSFLVTGESVVSFGELPDPYNSFTCFLSGKDPKTGLKWINFPVFSSYLFCNNKFMQPVDKVPQKMVCAVIANHRGQTRNRFLDRLEAKMRVEYGGSYRNNIGYCVGGNFNSNELLAFMRQYKFVVTMENNEEDYYITEKICNGLFAGVVPIYWGSSNICEYFNKDRIIHLEGGSDEEIDRVINKMISMDDTTYLEMVNSTILVNPLSHIIDEIALDIKSVINNQ